MKKLPIGISDYKKVKEDGYYYVDKTLLVRELLDTAGEVILMPRPRRFGKTLNLSMLKYFFEHTAIKHDYLFHDTAIWQDESAKKLQGFYPVVFLSFKDVKENTWDHAYARMTLAITREFERYAYILLPTLSSYHLKSYTAILERTAGYVEYGESLLFLSQLLSAHYQKRVMVLIDEYDTPIHAAYVHHYYEKLIDFMRSLLTTVLKDNNALERGILTGILRTAKEGIFSGLNNLSVFTLTKTPFSDKFGFTQEEVNQLLAYYNLLDSKDAITQWYNGYKFGDTVIYNPWSLIQCTFEHGVLKPYWVNTSHNQLIKKLIALSDVDTKRELEKLLTKKTVTQEIEEVFIFPGIERNPRVLWSILLFTGYVTYTYCNLLEGKEFCNLIIPNKEISILYKDLIKAIFEQALTLPKIRVLIQALKDGDSQTLTTLLQEFILNSASVYDFSEKDLEKSYHLFMLGLLVLLSDHYYITSNREGGYGRYDILLIPHEKNKEGIIIELKKVLTSKRETFQSAADRALEQIETMHYAQELRACQIKSIIAFGIAFEGKKVLAKARKL